MPPLPVPTTPLDSILNLDDFERSAHATLKPKSWAYYKSSADDGDTYERNTSIWRDVKFRPRVLRDVSGKVDTRVSILGNFDCSFPLMISPAAMGKLAHKDGELCIVEAAGRLGIPYAPSNHASISHADMAKASIPNQSLFFQLYLHKERWRSEAQIRQVRELGYKALIVTVDTPIPGKRELDERTGLDENAIGLANQGQKPGDKVSAIAQTSAVIDASLSWADMPWLRQVAHGMPIVVKGIHTVEDALMAYEVGANGIMLSNHGGRQTDTSNTPLETLLEIRRYAPELLASASRFTVIVDGGIRRGTDLVKALCLGAHCVSVARPFMFALCYGTPGVEKCGEILRDEVERACRLLGVTSVRDLSDQYVNASRVERRVVAVPLL
ncbi:hypothetical protein JCM10212_005235 [Sporobolomyces blumeae]